jgi:uncharacterized membrane protein
METRAPLVLSILLIAGMLAASAWAWPEISQHGAIATHFDLHGRPNGFMPPLRALLIAPVFAMVTTVLFATLPRFGRYRDGLAARSIGYQTGWIGALMVLFVVHCVIILKARGWPVDITTSSSAIIALVLIAVGNGLGKTRPNPFVGVRTPWTRKSEYSWDKTNRAAGRMLVGVGLATLATLAAAGGIAAHVTLVAGLAAMAVVSVYLSYHYWRTDPSRAGDSG